MAKKKTRHHRKPKSLGGDDSSRNISWISDKRHKAWHILFGNYAVWKIALIINKQFIDPDYVLVPEKRSEHQNFVDPNQLEIEFPL